MIIDQIFTSIVLGLLGGIAPGPIILLAFSESLKSKENGFKKGAIIFVYAATTELFIGLFLILTISFLSMPEFILHLLSVIGVFTLLTLSYRIFQFENINTKESASNVNFVYIFMILLFNAPLWIFWISVCVPNALILGNMIPYGEITFLFIFEMSMMIGLTIIFIIFNSFRYLFKKKETIRKFHFMIAFLLILIALKILYSEVMFFVKL